jgi:hypothetical protein
MGFEAKIAKRRERKVPNPSAYPAKSNRASRSPVLKVVVVDMARRL